MTIAAEHQLRLFHDFLIGEDGKPRPEVIVSTGMGHGEVIAKGGWAIQQEISGDVAETIIRMVSHTGKAIHVPEGVLADHATQSTPHIHLGSNFRYTMRRILVDLSDEGNIRVKFFGSDNKPSFQAFKLRDQSIDSDIWNQTFHRLNQLTYEKTHDNSRLIKLRTNFLQTLLDSPGTVLFTGVPESVAQMTSARIGASWGLVQETVQGVAEYFIRLRGEYDPAAQNAHGEMSGSMPVHQTWHSQHAHVNFQKLPKPVLTIGGPNGDEVIITFGRTVRAGFQGQSTATKAYLRLFATKGMVPDQIEELLRRNAGYLIDGRARS